MEPEQQENPLLVTVFKQEKLLEQELVLQDRTSLLKAGKIAVCFFCELQPCAVGSLSSGSMFGSATAPPVVNRRLPAIRAIMPAWNICFLSFTMLAIHDFITESVTYDKSDPEIAYNPLGPLLWHKGVCEGISEAFTFLANACGLKVAMTSGGKPSG